MSLLVVDFDGSKCVGLVTVDDFADSLFVSASVRCCLFVPETVGLLFSVISAV